VCTVQAAYSISPCVLVQSSRWHDTNDDHLPMMNNYLSETIPGSYLTNVYHDAPSRNCKVFWKCVYFNGCKYEIALPLTFYNKLRSFGHPPMQLENPKYSSYVKVPWNIRNYGSSLIAFRLQNLFAPYPWCTTNRELFLSPQFNVKDERLLSFFLLRPC
jgi:hypothetical protein